MKRLEAHVEAIVGPLRASEARKDRIREELLGHLEAARDEEGTALVDQAESAAIERLGSIEALRAELQASVPAWERWLWSPVKIFAPYEAVFDRDPERDRTPLRYAVRRTAVMMSFVGVLVSVLVAALSVLTPPRAGAASVLDEVAIILGALAVSTFASFYALEKTGVRARLDVTNSCSATVLVSYLTAFIALYVGSFLFQVHVLLLLDDNGSPMRWIASWGPRSLSIVLGASSFVVWLLWKGANDAKKRYARWGTAPRISTD